MKPNPSNNQPAQDAGQPITFQTEVEYLSQERAAKTGQIIFRASNGEVFTAHHSLAPLISAAPDLLLHAAKVVKMLDAAGYSMALAPTVSRLREVIARCSVPSKGETGQDEAVAVVDAPKEEFSTPLQMHLAAYQQAVKDDLPAGVRTYLAVTHAFVAGYRKGASSVEAISVSDEVLPPASEGGAK